MLIYLAARYSRREELCAYREDLKACGHAVTSRWLNGSHQISVDGQPLGDDGEAVVETGASGMAAHFATEDINDVQSSDVMVAFTEIPRASTSRGGRHVELGIAIALGKRIMIVGPRENVFCWLPNVIRFESWEACLMALDGGN